MIRNLLLVCSLFLLLPVSQQAQDGGRFSGNLEANGNFFRRDTVIGAANTPQYDNQLYGADAWLNMNYSNWGFDFGVRFDLFNNSNLLNPQGSYSDQGIGAWYINKNIDKLHIKAGYIYDQIGSGIIYRAYEQRALAIDNALVGLRLAYDLRPDWQVRVFTGRQKQQFALYGSVIKGMSIDGFISGGDEANWSIAPGFGIVNRTLDDGSMNSLIATLNTYLKKDAFVPVYNTYAFSVYNTLTAGKFSWYLEGAYKTKDAMNDEFLERETVSGDTIIGRFIDDPGTVVYTSIGYANKGWGITLEGKRTENFVFRTRPQEELFRGLINFLPPMARVNTYRLNARYTAAVQPLGEMAFQADVTYAPTRKLSFNANFSNITDLEGDLLYREIFTEVSVKKARKWQLLTGVQLQNYNQEVFEFKPGVPIVETVTPYADFLLRLPKKKSIRFEAQYMLTGEDHGVKHDYGDWVFGLIEFGIAPHWTFTVSDMYNIGPGKRSPVDAETGEKLKIHYPRVDVFYTYNSSRFSLSYVKQVEGIVCTGGICRVEPAFSGVKMTVNSSF
ncbi:MAG: hypothetical protein KDC34_05240 [Saprospiraceae bacterium]|nr:hypothetical protein [Saprospiraceae bacterium]